MTKKIRFYNRDGRWYADIFEYLEQGGTEEECEMVSGADIWLDFISKGKENIILKLSTSEILNEKLEFIENNEDEEYGAFYIAREYKEEPHNFILWICPVTLFVFGEYPKTIYYEIIK